VHTFGGVTLFWSPRPRRDVVLENGRLPRRCEGRTCEALGLGEPLAVGERFRLPDGLSLEIVGSGTLHPASFPAGSEDRVVSELGSEPLLVGSLEGPLRAIAASTPQTVVRTSALDWRGLHASEVPALASRMNRAFTHFERASSSATGAVPIPLLDSVEKRATVARTRVLLVAGEAAFLVLAFAVFIASAGIADVELLAEQLHTFGGTRRELVVIRGVEALVPSAAAAVVAVAGLWIGAHVVASRKGLSSGFVAFALPREALLAIVLLVVAAAVLFGVGARPLDVRLAPRALEVAALAALGVVVWQAATTHGLDPSLVATDQAIPVVLLLPALTFFVVGALMVRVLPLLLRVAEKASRRGSAGLRLGLVATARAPRVAAAATAFLAVAVGVALFGLDYRATLDRQDHEEAMFRAGAELRVIEHAGHPGAARQFGSASGGATASPQMPDVTPLTRFRRITAEVPTPVLRVAATVSAPSTPADGLPLEILGLPASRVSNVLGWRPGFSSDGVETIASALRRHQTAWAGLRIARSATALRIWLRGDREVARDAVLQALDAGQAFHTVPLGFVGRTWHLVRIPLPPVLRGGQVLGIDFPTFSGEIPSGYTRGFVDLGGFQEEVAGRWIPLRGPLWSARANDGGGTIRRLAVSLAPGSPAVRFVFRDPVPVLRTNVDVPQALDAAVSPAVAAAAVDDVMTVDVAGTRLPLRVAAEAGRFPTIVHSPTRFAVVDYATLFAAVNFHEPGAVPTSEAWFWKTSEGAVLSQLQRPPFRLEFAVGPERVSATLHTDPLARATTLVLVLTAIVAAVLAFLGLLFSTKSILDAERAQLAEYEALGIAPRTLLRVAYLRLLSLSVVGFGAGIVGSVVTVHLIAAFVAVTAGTVAPVVPIEPTAAWLLSAIAIVAVATAAVGGSAVLTRRAFAEGAARRLRA
jgi:hypothetical protein